ncbi:SAM-dependent methyltransferase [Catenuloplanes nepalensis]|uniref:SAM-dependent methyltransferase n=1 Tax=Catenuloplanes nepalensis TaxID=587533 RepID=A0ABT9MQS7_9ACTN|nr:class I SAM-dependent methyltransferase [Catenuloplanes nepalensis]MDP9793753.1 SAM-dependent methyltransferase [Catenuloplanes nepalensis]
MTSPLPDYDTIARDWDTREDVTRPVAGAIVDLIPVPADGALVLDLGCGTGEPGLTVAARYPGVRLLGVDRSAPMVEIARAKARRLGLDGATFEVRLMSDVGLEPASVDVVVSRMSLLMQDFQDVGSSVTECARVLRPGGTFSFAVFDRAELNPLIAAFYLTLRDFPGADALPNPFALDDLAAPGYRGGLLRRAGFASVEEAPFTWDWRVAGDEALIEVLRTSPFGPFLGTLTDADRATAGLRVVERAAAYREPDGGYRFPTTCRLFWGSR